jgi:hypothetical protein
LVRVFAQSFGHALRLLGTEALKLIKERHLFDFLFRILFNFRLLARDFRFVNLRFALNREIRASAHRQARRDHSSQTGNQNVVLLIVRGACDPGDDSENRSQSIIHAINCIRDPTAAASVPSFAF